jgi:hypothetical protein
LNSAARNSGAAAITVLVDTLIGYYALEPVMQELSRRGCYLYVCAPARIHAPLIPLLASAGLANHPLADVGEDAAFAKRLHRVLRQLFTRPSFSFQYRLLSHPDQHPDSFAYWLLVQFARLSPGLPHNRVNRALAKIVGRFVRNRFPTSTVLTVSRSSLAHLLCARGLRVITVLESWDHPVKWPVGHSSEAVFVWNEDLAKDWREYQGDRDVIVTYPFKLRYWIARNLPVRELGVGRRAVYAVGTSSMSYMNQIHLHELRMIEAVCEATGRTGWRLVIKPKPNGKLGDFDGFADRFPHVSLGTYRDVISPTDYYLDEAYNLIRERELGEADLVINSLTTFALDAALGGVPCLQLDLRACPEYQGAAEGQTNHHIARYLLRDPALCVVGEPTRLVENLVAFFGAPDDRPERFSRHLRGWLAPRRRYSDAVAMIADRVLAPKPRSAH